MVTSPSECLGIGIARACLGGASVYACQHSAYLPTIYGVQGMVWMILNHVKLSISLSPFLRKVQHDFASPCAALLWLASHALGRAQKDAVSITTLHPRLVTVRGSCSWTAESDAAPSRALLRISTPISLPPPLRRNLRNSGARPHTDANRCQRMVQGWGHHHTAGWCSFN